MKKLFNITFTALAIISLSIACSKETAEDIVPDVPQEENPQKPEQPKQITISATLSDDILSLVPSSTKVSFDPSVDENGKITSMTLKWELTDKLRITDASNAENYSIFSNPSISEDGKRAYFTGDLPTGAEAYNVSVLDGKADPEPDTESGITTQTQPSDGVSNVKYWAEATNVSEDDLHDNFTLNHLSGILAFTIKMSSTDAADEVMSINISASEGIFYGGNKLTLRFDKGGDANKDGLLYFFATLPASSCTDIPACSLIVHINAPGTAHTVYTRYIEMGATTFTAGKVNRININATNSATYANSSTTNIGTAANPYLIGDKYQMDAIHDLLVGDETRRYFKLIDDINMSDITWVPLNNVADNKSHFSKYVSFDGNGHTISYITTKDSPGSSENYPSIFGVLNGSVSNLTIDHATIYPGSYKAGVLAGYIGSSDCTITPSVENITITNSTVGTSTKKGSSSCGILCAQTDKANITISNISISDCGVVSTSTSSSQGIGGMIGYIHRQMTISGNNTISNTTVTGGSYVGGMIGNINTATATYQTTISGTNTVSSTNVSGTNYIGGVVGSATSKTNMSGCTYTGGTVSAFNRFAGGMIGSTGDQESIISECTVKDATIDVTDVSTTDPRSGGFAGLIHTSVTVKGCTVGTLEKHVTLKTGTPKDATTKLNCGGFVGCSYGTITKNGDVRNKAYVTITSTNPTAETNSDYTLYLGGFTGYHSGTIEYTDAVVTMNDICGKYVGGFCGLLTGGTIKNSTVSGNVSGNLATGGFLGYSNNTNKNTITECSSNAIVTRTGSWGTSLGVFAGIIDSGTYTKCSALADINISSTSYVGGFAGGIETSADRTCTISKSWSTGKTTVNSAQCSSFIARIAANTAGTVKIEDCYSTGDIINSNQRRGGLIGQITSGIITISRCYASGNLNASFAQGGLVGFMGTTATIQDCAAWNSSVTASSIGAANWSSGAVVGVAWPVATLTNNIRKPDMSIKAYWGNVAGYTKQLGDDYDHPDVSSENPLIVVDKSSGNLRATTATSAASGQDNYPLFAYHGKHIASGTSLSTIASTAKENGGLGWSSDVWDFTGDLPTLK